MPACPRCGGGPRRSWPGGGGHWAQCEARTGRSTVHGFLAADGLPIPLALTGCTSKRDAASNDTICAGIRIRNFGGTITITGCQVFPGLNDDGTGKVTSSL